MRERLEQQSFLAFLILVTVAFLLLLRPFYAPVFWAFAVALIFFPMQRRLLARWPGRRNLAAMITLLLSIVVVVIPVPSFEKGWRYMTACNRANSIRPATCKNWRWPSPPPITGCSAWEWTSPIWARS